MSKQLFVQSTPAGSSHTFHLLTERGPVHEHCVSQPFHLTIVADPVYDALDISVIYHTVDVAQQPRNPKLSMCFAPFTVAGQVPRAYIVGELYYWLTVIRTQHTTGRLWRGTARNQTALNYNVCVMSVCFCSGRNVQLCHTSQWFVSYTQLVYGRHSAVPRLSATPLPASNKFPVFIYSFVYGSFNDAARSITLSDRIINVVLRREAVMF